MREEPPAARGETFGKKFPPWTLLQKLFAGFADFTTI
jgi:hypothetical protein